MGASQAAVELLFTARNLADGAVADLTGSLKKVGDAGASAAGRIGGAFAGMGEKLANGIGMATETLASGGSLGQAAAQMGIFMAGQLAEQFGGQLLEKLASSSLLEAVTAPLAALGSTIGSVIAAAIPIGMALLPFILVGALVAAITVLIVNPEIRGKVFDFVAGLVGKIGDFLRAGLTILADIVPKAFGAAWQLVTTALPKAIGAIVDLWLALPLKLIGLGGDILRTILGGLATLPGRVADIIVSAFSGLHLDIGPFHISAAGVRVDLPNIDIPHFAGGVRNFAGGMALVGEDGPELVRLPRGSDVVPNGATRQLAGQGAGVAGVQLVGVSESQLMDLVERGLYFRLKRSGAARAG